MVSRKYQLGRNRNLGWIPGRRVADRRQYRAKEYQWNKVETFEEMCQRIESCAS